MVRRLLLLGLVAMVISTLATVAAVRSSTEEAEAQAAPYPMTTLCRDYYTSFYKGSFTGNCPPGHQLLELPDDYPISLCVGAYDGFLRAPNYTGQCPPATSLRIELPSNTQPAVCYIWATGRLRLPTPYGSTNCGAGGYLVAFPFQIGEDSYQTLGNVDLNVPASDGVLSNDTGPGLILTASDTTSANGGEVNVYPDGSFAYTPPMPDPNAFTGNDTFTYTVEDSNAVVEVVTVTIQVLNPVVWFVDVDATDPGDGRRQTPLNDLQVLNDDGNDPDNSGDVIYLFEAVAPYAGGLVLEDSQTLVGQEVSLAEILDGELGIASSLQGVVPGGLPPHMILPETNPTGDIPLLTNGTTTLVMVNDTTAAGLTIVSETEDAILVDFAENVLVDTVIANGADGETAGDGIEVVESELRLVDSEISGGNGLAPPPFNGESQLQGFLQFGVSGGNGIAAFDSVLDISETLVQGGDGAEATEDGGSGGFGILAGYSSLDSSSILFGLDPGTDEITVTNSQVIGGNGGAGSGSGEGFSEGSTLLGDDPPGTEAFGGDGADGIVAFVGPDFRRAEQSGLQGLSDGQIDMTVSNSQVQGGSGGFGVDEGGEGGHGIESIGLHTTVDQSSMVTGGVGGLGLVLSAGQGGAGIHVDSELNISSAESSGSSLLGPGGMDPGSLTVDSSTVTGGLSGTGGAPLIARGGNGIQTDRALPLGTASESTLAGNGNSVLAITITNATITGAAGAANPGQIGGLPGNGIFALDADLLIESGSVVSGGAGGPGDTGSTGGNGVDVQSSQVTITDSTVNGGDGGHSDNEAGATGGIGVSFHDCVACFTTTISGSEINGGDGGTSNSMAGGAGGIGILGGNDSLDVTASTVRGGTPAENGGGREGFGPGAAAIVMTYEEPAFFTILLTGNTLVGTAGDPVGQEPSLDVSVSAGVICIDATGNIPTGPFELVNSDGLAITQASLADLSTDNNGVTVNPTGSIGFNCSIQLN